MNKSATLTILSIAFFLWSAPLFAEEITGQLIDLACYAQDKENTGNHHKNRGVICAQACAREGFAVGLLTQNGTVYRVTGDLAANYNAKLVPQMTRIVTLTGDVTHPGGQNVIAANALKVVRQ
jgi:hypothetical protein